MSALWFIGFSLIWTGILATIASMLSRDPVPARFAHTIWRGAALLAVLPWILVGLFSGLPSLWETQIPDLPYIEGAASVLNETLPVQAVTASEQIPYLGVILTSLLVGGWAVRAGANLLCQIRLQNIKASAEPASGLNSDRWARLLGLKQAPQIARIHTGSPFLAGISKRTVYLPAAITAQADADIILAHECTHMARGDLITRPFERLIADIFWFSPFAWQMRRQLDYWREAACDEQTAQLTGDSVAYARALAQTARVIRPQPTETLPVAAFILPERSTLKRRLTQLLKHDARQPRRGFAIVSLALGLALAPLALAQSGSFASNTLYSHAVLEVGKISSPFGERWDPVTNKKTTHAGVDIKAKKGAAIFAPASGKILYSGKKEGYGYTIDMKFEDGTKMRFAQLQKSLVKKGDWIESGKVIGKVGESGRATGPHLHLEIWRDGEMWDPEKEKGLELYIGCCDRG